MKVLFTKYGRERLPSFQVETALVEIDKGKRVAIKKAINADAKRHLERMVDSFNLLTKNHDVACVKPTWHDDTLWFEFADGVSLEQKLLVCVEKKDSEKFRYYLALFVTLLEKMVTKQKVVFEPTESFISIFGTERLSSEVDLVGIGNIDLIFGNVFINADDEFQLIDYEWVFDFALPIRFVLWRAIHVFKQYHRLPNPFVELLDSCVELSEPERVAFQAWDVAFGHYVHGRDRKYAFRYDMLQNVVGFKEVPNTEFQIQLFYDKGNGFTEEDSIRLPVTQLNEAQTITFDFLEQKNISHIRFDPLNDSCVIEIFELNLVLTNGHKIDLIPFMQSNDRTHHGNAYFFDTNDPILTFSDYDFSQHHDIDSFEVSVRFAHIGQEAVRVTMEQLAKDFQLKAFQLGASIESLSQTQGELAQTQGELAQTQGELAQTQGELAQTQGELAQTQGELAQTQGELAQTQGELAQTQGELAQTQGELAQTQGELAQTQGKLLNIYRSNSWGITKPLRIALYVFKRVGWIFMISKWKKLLHVIKLGYQNPDWRRKFFRMLSQDGLKSTIKRVKEKSLLSGNVNFDVDDTCQKSGFFNPFELVYHYKSQSEVENFQSRLTFKQVAIGCASGGNFFMHEISKLLSCAFHEMGIEVFHFNENQVFQAVNADLTIVVAPHEFFILGDGSALLGKLAMAKKLVMLNTEQAQTHWFANALPYLEHAHFIWDMNYQSAVLLRANNLPAYFLPLGYSLNYQTKLAPTQALRRSLPLLSLSQSVTSTIEDQDYSKRPIDVLFVGTISDKRRQFFAQHAGYFAAFECFFYLPEGNQPFNENEDRTLDFQQLAGLARRSKILINIHRDTANYLEWQRIVNLGVFCGTLVISETCDSSPALVPSLDYIDVPLELLAQTCNRYLSDLKAAQAFVERATAHLTSQQKLSQTLAFLLTDMM